MVKLFGWYWPFHGCVSVSDGGKCGVDGVRLELGRHVTVRQGPVGQCPRNKTKPVVGEVLSEVVWVVVMVMVDSIKEQITHTFTRSFVFIMAPLNLLPEKTYRIQHLIKTYIYISNNCSTIILL